MPDTPEAGEKTLKLNGLGLRKKAVFTSTWAGCTGSPSKDAGAILTAEQFNRDSTECAKEANPTPRMAAYGVGSEKF